MDYKEYQQPDYYKLDDLLTEEHIMIRSAVRDWVNQEIIPFIDKYAQEQKPFDVMKQLGAIGALGPYIPTEYGGAGLDQISYGLIMQELERGDSAIRSSASVQSSLVMYPIFTFGSEEQKKKYLPPLAMGEMVGCFGLTEPNHGSNPAGMETKYEDKGDHYLLNGAKMWITNSPVSDIAIVWAKHNNSKDIRGFIIERGYEGFSTPMTKDKWSLRASATGEIVLENVKVPKENMLPNVEGLKGPLSCLNSARYGISWGVIGAAMDCYDTARRYSVERKQFGKEIGGFQLQQKKLAEFLTEITKAQLLAWRLGVLKNENKATPAQISMAKRNNVEMAINIARASRQILGGMGIMGEFPMMRHMANLESVITYEGTHDIHLLITGYDITGINAFE